MNKFSNCKILFRLPYITKIVKFIYMYVANIVPISCLAMRSNPIAMFCKFSETAKSVGETPMQKVCHSVADLYKYLF